MNLLLVLRNDVGRRHNMQNYAAVRARILDHLTGAVAVRAGLLNREEALRHTDRTAAAAVRAGRLGGAGLAAGTVTGFAGIPHR